MITEQMLHEKLTTYTDVLGNGDIDFYQKNIPDCIVNNVNTHFEIRPYQLEAFGRFKYYKESYPNRPKNSPTQVL